jgi:hypothetical protein
MGGAQARGVAQGRNNKGSNKGSHLQNAFHVRRPSALHVPRRTRQSITLDLENVHRRRNAAIHAQYGRCTFSVHWLIFAPRYLFPPFMSA